MGGEVGVGVEVGVGDRGKCGKGSKHAGWFTARLGSEAGGAGSGEAGGLVRARIGSTLTSPPQVCGLRVVANEDAPS